MVPVYPPAAPAMWLVPPAQSSASSMPSLTDQASESEDENAIGLLSESEALEYVEFDPTVQKENSRDTLSSIQNFIEKNFNHSLSEGERKAILKDFPKPSCEAIQVPRLDDWVKEHLRSRCKDPHFGLEKTLKGAVYLAHALRSAQCLMQFFFKSIEYPSSVP